MFRICFPFASVCVACVSHLYAVAPAAGLVDLFVIYLAFASSLFSTCVACVYHSQF